jgi:hypothetical protein
MSLSKVRTTAASSFRTRTSRASTTILLYGQTGGLSPLSMAATSAPDE